MEKPLVEQKKAKTPRRTNIRDIRRDELTSAALRCIATKGYDRVTLDDVANESGFSQGIVLYYFKNREDLLASSAEKIRDDMLSLTQRMLDIPTDLLTAKRIHEPIRARFSDPKIDFISFARQGIKLFIGWFEENLNLIAVGLEFFCQVRRNPVIAAVRDEVQPIIHNASAAFIDEGIKQEIFKKRDPEYAANIMLSLITGLAFAYVTTEKGLFNSDKMEKELCNLIFGYL